MTYIHVKDRLLADVQPCPETDRLVLLRMFEEDPGFFVF
jgi:hypothetical protein